MLRVRSILGARGLPRAAQWTRPRNEFHSALQAQQKAFEITDEMLSTGEAPKKGTDEQQEPVAGDGKVGSTDTRATERDIEDKFLASEAGKNTIVSPFQAALSSLLEKHEPEAKFTRHERTRKTDKLDGKAILRNVGNLLDPVAKAPGSGMIILNQKKIYASKNSIKLKRKESTAASVHADVYDLLKKKDVGKTGTDSEEFIGAIEALKPPMTSLHASQYDALVRDLAKAFNRVQLRAYVKMHPLKTGISAYKKLELAKHILSSIWNVKRIETVDNVKDLIREERFQLTPRSLKLLLSSSSRMMILGWRSLGAEVSIDDSERMIVRAPQNLVRYIKISMNSLLDRTKADTLDLSQFGAVAMDDALLDHLGTVTEVVYEREDTTVNVFSLNEHRLRDLKMLLASSLDTGSWVHDVFVGSAETSSKFPMNDSISRPEYLNHKRWFRYQRDRSRIQTDEELFDDILDYETINDDLKDLMLRQVALEPLLEDIKDKSFDRNYQDRVRLYDRSKDSEAPPVEAAVAEESVVESVPEGVATQDAVDTDVAFEKLSDGGMVTATLGSVLVDEKDDQRVFQGHLPFVNRTIADLPMFRDKVSPDKDNFDYLYKIKLIPDPYKNHDNISKYPPVEFWFETEGRYIDEKSLRIVRVDSETSLHYSLPSFKSDLKLTASKASDIDTDFDSARWLAKQPEVLEFLQDSSLSAVDFKESSMRDNCTIRFGNDKVEYLVVGSQQRRQLELSYKGHLVQYSIVDNGHYHGRNLEVNLVANLAGERIERPEFDEFVSTAVDFIRQL